MHRDAPLSGLVFLSSLSSLVFIHVSHALSSLGFLCQHHSKDKTRKTRLKKLDEKD